MKKTEDEGEKNGETSRKKTFRGGKLLQTHHTATFGNMDTLFSVFLGLLFLFSTVGNVSGQIPTGKDGKDVKQTVFCVVERKSSVHLCLSPVFSIRVYAYEFPTGVFAVQEKS